MMEPRPIQADPWISADGFAIAALLAGGERRAEQPTLTVVAGQMGAGKSVALRAIIDGLPQGEAWALLDANALHQTHPAYAATESRSGTAAAMEASAQHAAKWAKLLQDDAVATRRHVAMEVASPDTDLTAIASGYAALGYKTRLVVLAVPEHLSRQRIVSRELNERRAMGHGRHVSSTDHDRAYARWPIALAKQLAAHAFDQVEVASPSADGSLRTATLAGAAKSTDSVGPQARWRGRAESLLDALVAERTAPLDASSVNRHTRRWDVLTEMLPPGRRYSLDQQAAKDRERLSSSHNWRLQREGRLVLQAAEPGENEAYKALSKAFATAGPKVAPKRADPRRGLVRGLFGLSA